MNRQLARKVADAVLYEGYMLYPYRRSALKNRQRWSFGILYPPAYTEVQSGTERPSMHSEFLVETDGQAKIQVELRFLQLVNHQASHSAKLEAPASTIGPEDGWEEGIERRVELEIALDCPLQDFQFAFPGSTDTDSTQDAVRGTVSTFSKSIRDGVLKMSIDVKNTTPLGCDSARAQDRDSALLRSLVSAHVILSAAGARFVSLLDPGKDLQEPAKACSNIGNFPVVLGSPGEREMLLCSPIILYDYPQVAPESAGDFYDATEMDEMLILRTLTMTADEKDQARNADVRVRNLLERSEETAREQLMKTHGAIRSLQPVIEESEE